MLVFVFWALESTVHICPCKIVCLPCPVTRKYMITVEAGMCENPLDADAFTQC